MDPLKDVMEEIETRIAKLKQERGDGKWTDLRVYDFKNGSIAALNDLLSLLELYKTTHKL